MKKMLSVLVVLFLASCTERELYEGVADVQKSETVVNGQFASLLEQARWGDGKACLKLAEYYHDGVGSKPDFINTISMLAMADQYGGIRGFESFWRTQSKIDGMRMIYETFDRLEPRKYEIADSIADVLISKGSEDGYVLKGIAQIERKDTLGGIETIRLGAEKGSSLGELLLCAVLAVEGKNEVYLEKLSALSDRIPLASKLLGDIYSGYEGVDMIDEPLAVKYYIKADEKGCLGKRPARWLINYYNRKGIQIDTKEMERLQILSGNRNETDEYIPDSVKIDLDYLEIDSCQIIKN